METQPKDVGTLEGLRDISSEEFANALFSNDVTKNATKATQETSTKEPEGVDAKEKAPDTKKEITPPATEDQNSDNKGDDKKSVATDGEKKDDTKKTKAADGKSKDDDANANGVKNDDGAKDDASSDTSNEFEFKLPEEKKAEADGGDGWETDRKSTRLNSSHSAKSRMPSSA